MTLDSRLTTLDSILNREGTMAKMGGEVITKNIIFLCVLCVFVVNNLHFSIGAERLSIARMFVKPLFVYENIQSHL